MVTTLWRQLCIGIRRSVALVVLWRRRRREDDDDDDNDGVVWFGDVLSKDQSDPKLVSVPCQDCDVDAMRVGWIGWTHTKPVFEVVAGWWFEWVGRSGDVSL